jgi:sulfur carrier protein
VELVLQAERKVGPSTLRPDLDNANVGSLQYDFFRELRLRFPVFIGDDAMVKINGEQLDKAGKTVAEMLAEMNISELRVAVEINEVIVPKASYSDTVLKDGDTVEVVRFVGGG